MTFKAKWLARNNRPLVEATLLADSWVEAIGQAKSMVYLVTCDERVIPAMTRLVIELQPENPAP